jgi:hypothetical protein
MRRPGEDLPTFALLLAICLALVAVAAHFWVPESWAHAVVLAVILWTAGMAAFALRRRRSV